jgi:molybdenum cofactor biosynthesis enzyme MoaA
MSWERMDTSVAINKRAILHECSERHERVTNLPFYYHVYLNMPCNQKCIMCVPNGEHAKDLLPLPQFVALFEQIKPYAEHITLIGGEPLIYPWINEVLDLLSQNLIEVTINTNATRLRDQLRRRLLSLHALNLKCSIDAARRSTYFRIRGTDSFDLVSQNLHQFSIAARNKPNMRMLLVYVVMRENLDEVLPFIDFARNLAPHRIEFHPVRHVMDWHVTNDTDWVFDGRQQSCESFKDQYNEVMSKAAARCEEEGFQYEVQLL